MQYVSNVGCALLIVVKDCGEGCLTQILKALYMQLVLHGSLWTACKLVNRMMP
jgi:hypothetical protein